MINIGSPPFCEGCNGSGLIGIDERHKLIKCPICDGNCYPYAQYWSISVEKNKEMKLRFVGDFSEPKHYIDRKLGEGDCLYTKDEEKK